MLELILGSGGDVSSPQASSSSSSWGGWTSSSDAAAETTGVIAAASSITATTSAASDFLYYVSSNLPKASSSNSFLEHSHSVGTKAESARKCECTTNLSLTILFCTTTILLLIIAFAYMLQKLEPKRQLLATPATTSVSTPKSGQQSAGGGTKSSKANKTTMIAGSTANFSVAAGDSDETGAAGPTLKKKQSTVHFGNTYLHNFFSSTGSAMGSSFQIGSESIPSDPNPMKSVPNYALQLDSHGEPLLYDAGFEKFAENMMKDRKHNIPTDYASQMPATAGPHSTPVYSTMPVSDVRNSVVEKARQELGSMDQQLISFGGPPA
ncbi:unnamed protein product [Amoebophrya sp. A120]|nr:unnamed protein product [Amoebophrya sp. A120]|eukprot:GSA120T00019339001.1